MRARAPSWPFERSTIVAGSPTALAMMPARLVLPAPGPLVSSKRTNRAPNELLQNRVTNGNGNLSEVVDFDTWAEIRKFDR